MTVDVVKCPKCRGHGYISQPYLEIMDADGPFYDRNVVREVREIKVRCKTCKGSKIAS